MVLIVVESILRLDQRLPKTRVNDGIGSVSAGMLMIIGSKVRIVEALNESALTESHLGDVLVYQKNVQESTRHVHFSNKT